MAMRIRKQAVEEVLDTAGHRPAEWDEDIGDWEPGYRAVQRGPRWVLLFHEGPAEEGELARYLVALREKGFHVQTDQMPRSGRHRLEVTRT